MSSHLCGVYYTLEEYEPYRWLPLVSLSANATICQNSSRLVLKQEFVSTESTAISEAAYSFPIYECDAVVAFTCRIQDRVIHGVIREKQEAKKLYEIAKEEGKRAVLMLKNAPDVWSARISNIPAGAKVEVEITTVSELKHDAQADGIRFVFPTNIAPRYGQEPENLPPSIGPKASKGVEMTVAVTMTSPITSLQSPSHPISVGIGSHLPGESLPKEAIDVCKGHATLSQNATVLEKDFVLIVVSADIGKPQAILETHPTLDDGQRALLLSLVPKFDVPRIKPEIVFIADRSGSMDDKVVQLRHALQVFLRSLPVGVKFNICSFGSEHTFLWEKSRTYDQDNLDIALKHVETFEADYGGTEMFPPVEAALKNRYKDLQTEIIILTDGEIWNTKSLFDLVQKECEGGDVRLFSVGLGDSVSHSLVEGLARAGRGYAQIVGNTDKLDAKLVRMLKAALGAHVSNYKLSFQDSPTETRNPQEEDKEGFEFVEDERTSDENKTQSTENEENQNTSEKVIPLYDDTSSDKSLADEPAPTQEDRFAHLPTFEPPTRIQTPYQIPPLFPFNRTNIYVLLSGSVESPQSVMVQGTTTSGIRLELEVPLTDFGKGTTVHQLAATKLLQELEEGGSYLGSGQFGVDPVKDEGKFADWVEREGIRVGTTFGVAGKWTSFVAVEDGEDLAQPQPSSDDLVYPSTEGSAMPFSLFSSSLSTISAGPVSLQSMGPMHSSVVVKASAPHLRMHASLSRLSPPSYPKPEANPELLPFGAPSGSHLDSSSLQREEEVCVDGGLEQMDDFGLNLYSFEPQCGVDVASGEESELELFSGSLSSDTEGRPGNSRLYGLLGMQAFDGSFPPGSGDWAAELSSAFHTWMEEEHAEHEVGGLRSLTEEQLGKLITSAVAVAIFEGELKYWKDTWEMVVEKTHRWGVETVGDNAWNALKVWASQQLANADEQKKQRLWVMKK